MNRTRPKQIAIRASEAEYEKVKSQIEKSGLSQQDYLLRAITDKAIVNTDGIKVVMPELKRIGNNLNQIAKSCNEGNQATHDEVVRLGKELNDVWLLLKRLAQGQA